MTPLTEDSKILSLVRALDVDIAQVGHPEASELASALDVVPPCQASRLLVELLVRRGTSRGRALRLAGAVSRPRGAGIERHADECHVGFEIVEL